MVAPRAPSSLGFLRGWELRRREEGAGARPGGTRGCEHSGLWQRGPRAGSVRLPGLVRDTAGQRCGLEWWQPPEGRGVSGKASRARPRRRRGGRALGPHGSVAGPRLLPGVRGCVMGGGGGLASCRVRRKVFNMAAGAPGPLCGGGVGPELPSPERPTLRTRVPHHHLVPRPPGVPGPG